MKFLSLTAVTFLMASSTALIQPSQHSRQAGTAAPRVERRLSVAAHETYRNGENVVVVVRFENLSDHPLQELRTPSGGDPGLSLIVKDGAGRVLPEKEPDQSLCHAKPKCEIVRLRTGSQVELTLRPGDSFWEHVNLSDLYDLSRPGTYTVQAFHGDPAHAELFSAPVTVLVVP